MATEDSRQHLIIQDSEGAFYKLSPDVLDSARMSDDDVEKHLRDVGGSAAAAGAAGSSFVRMTPASNLVRSTPSAAVRMAPTALWRMAPSSAVRMTPSSAWRMAPSSAWRMTPASQMVRAAPTQAARAAPAVVQSWKRPA